MKGNLDSQTEGQLDETSGGFSLINSDAPGMIDIRELKAAMRPLGFEVKNEECKKIVEDVNNNGNGTIDREFPEFLTLLTPLLNPNFQTAY